MGHIIVPSSAVEPPPLREFLRAAVELPPYPFPEGPFSGEALRLANPSDLRASLSRFQVDSRAWARLLGFWRFTKACGQRMGEACADFPIALGLLEGEGFPITEELLQWAPKGREQSVFLASRASASLAFVEGGSMVSQAEVAQISRGAMADLALVPTELREAARQAVREGHLRGEGLGAIFQAYLKNVGRKIPHLGLPIVAVMLTGVLLSSSLWEEAREMS